VWRQRNSNRLLVLAAGLVVVLGGGIVARGLISSNNNDNSIAIDAAATADQSLSPRAELEVEAAEETFSDTGDAGDATASKLSTADAPAALNADTLLGNEGEGSPDEGLEVLSSPEDLAVFANDLNRTTLLVGDANVQAAPGASPFPLCDLVTRVVGPALWDAPGLSDVPVVVGIDDVAGEAVAYQPDDCKVTARTPLLR
jgi:hypothetical protein